MTAVNKKGLMVADHFGLTVENTVSLVSGDLRLVGDALSISGTVELSNREWIEVWVKIDNPTNPDNLNVNTYNLLIQSVK